MEINQIRYFLEVAQSGHVTASAEKLHIAQPALTQTIKRLERELGVPLLEKKGRNIVLTEYGVYLKKKLTPVISQIDSIPMQIAELAGVRSKTVHLNVLAASYLVSSAVIEYKKRNEDISFVLTQKEEEDLFDIEITTEHHNGKRPEGENGSGFICSEDILIAVPRSGEYSKRQEITIDELKEEKFISLAGSRHFRSICDLICKKNGFIPNIVFESDDPSTVQEMIAANMGIGFWPEFTWPRQEHESVKKVKISSAECKRDIIIEYRKELGAGRESAEDFYEYLKNYFIDKKSKCVHIK